MNIKIEDFIVSTRVRLARNVVGLPFSAGFKENEALARAVMESLGSEGGFSLLALKSMDEISLHCLKEQHLISPALIQRSESAFLALGYDKTASIMIGEEDMIRQQAILSGFELEKAWQILNNIDDRLAKKIDFCFNSKLGFLTSCPTNLGTAMRASVMMFLPALAKLNEIQKIIETLSAKNITVRGVYGEGSNAEGYLYQVSNQKSLGISEDAILALVTGVVSSLIDAEASARQIIYANNQVLLTDQIMRAYGLLTNAYRMESREFMELMSFIKLGKYYGILPNLDIKTLDNLIIEAQPFSLQKHCARMLDGLGRDLARCEYIKKQLA